jgi:hypothetical protein
LVDCITIMSEFEFSVHTGEANIARAKNSSAIIARDDVRRFVQLTNTDDVFGTHT